MIDAEDVIRTEERLRAEQIEMGMRLSLKSLEVGLKYLTDYYEREKARIAQY